MDRHIQILLKRISCASVTIATFTLLFLFLQTPETCVPEGSIPKPHQKFPKSTCDFSHRSLTSLDKKNKKLWSTKDWRNKVQSFVALFRDLQSLNHLNNHSRVLCVSAGAGHEVMALKQIGVGDVTGVELVDSPPLVSRADPHNLPFFDGVFDLGFSAHLDEALFPSRFAAEMERTVRVGGVCVVAVEECGVAEAKELAKLYRKSRAGVLCDLSISAVIRTFAYCDVHKYLEDLDFGNSLEYPYGFSAGSAALPDLNGVIVGSRYAFEVCPLSYSS